MLELHDISVRYAVQDRPLLALSRVELGFPAGSITTVVGRSGSGKTTLLRLIAGLQAPSSGSIERGGVERVGYVFQEPRLMPWLSVHENVGFGLPAGLDKRARTARIGRMIDQVGLTDFANAMPGELSGGMASRVAIARALAPLPDMLLMDEPFAALDAFTRRSMQAELVRLWQRHRPTTVFITHDVEEAVLLGERVIELVQGRLVDVHPVDMPFPREATDPELLQHRRAILQRLLQEPNPEGDMACA